MEATIKSNEVSISLSAENSKTKPQSKFWKEAEANRFGISPGILTIMAIMGGIGATYGIVDSWFQLALVVIPSTFCLSLILGLASMRVLVISSSIAVLIDLLIIVF